MSSGMMSNKIMSNIEQNLLFSSPFQQIWLSCNVASEDMQKLTRHSTKYTFLEKIIYSPIGSTISDYLHRFNQKLT